MALFKSVCLLIAITIAFCSSTELFSNENHQLINANRANVNQFPYQVAVTSNSEQSGLVFCSGSLLHFRWVLTAATCVLESSSFQIRVAAITHYTGGRVHVTENAYIHPHYDPTSNANNVALLSITQFTANGVPVSLLPANLDNWDVSGRIAVLTAWSLSQLELNRVSPVLQYAYGSILNKTHPNCVDESGANQSNNLCANFYGQSSCSGDAGSPLAIQVNRTWFQIGVAIPSGDHNVCKDSTSTFLPISSIRGWISNVTHIEF